MMRSLYSGVSGLKTHQTKMDVIGNNIANVNTVAYKSSSVTFSELMYQTTSSASAANAESGRGGVNGKQIGLGVTMGATNVSITTTGATQTTGNPFDIKITGNSFFVVSDGISNYFTRAGAFYVDAVGNLCMTSTGYNVMGWQVGENGEIEQNTVSALKVMSDDNMYSQPEATEKVTCTGVLDKSDSQLATSAGKVLGVTFYDDLGYEYNAKFSITPVTTASLVTKEVTTTTSKYSFQETITASNSSDYTFKVDGSDLKKIVTPAGFESQIANYVKTHDTAGNTSATGMVDGDKFIFTSAIANSLGVDANSELIGSEITVNIDTKTKYITSTGAELSMDKKSMDYLVASGIYNSVTNPDGSVTYSLADSTMSLYRTEVAYDDGSSSQVSFKTSNDPTDAAAAVDLDTTQMSADGLNALLGVGGEQKISNVVTKEQVSENSTIPGQYEMKLVEIVDVANGKTTLDLTALGDTAQRIVYDTNEGKFQYIGEEDDQSTVYEMNLSALGGNFKDIEIDFSTTKNVSNSGTSTIGMKTGDADGKGAGKLLGALTGIAVDNNGKIYGSYDNGNTELLGQICVTEFANASGLEKVGENLYQTTLNSGNFDGIGKDISALGGSMSTGVLEMSNVDLSAEFTEMITTQRGFQANSRIITTSDTLLEELINLKR